MRLDGYKSSIKIPQKEAFEFLENPHNFQKLMPEELTFFNASDAEFTFQLSGMPIKISLNKKEVVEFSSITYESAGNMKFQLKILFSKITEERTEVSFIFEGKLNPMIRAMAEKPLKKLLKVFSNRIARLLD